MVSGRRERFCFWEWVAFMDPCYETELRCTRTACFFLLALRYVNRVMSGVTGSYSLLGTRVLGVP